VPGRDETGNGNRVEIHGVDVHRRLRPRCAGLRPPRRCTDRTDLVEGSATGPGTAVHRAPFQRTARVSHAAAGGRLTGPLGNDDSEVLAPTAKASS
jgi:hypothetical protein